MSVKVIRRKIEARKVTITMAAAGSLPRGKMKRVQVEVVPQRVRDILTRSTGCFIVVFDTTAKDKSGQVLILNKRNHCLGIAAIWSGAPGRR